MSLIDREKTMEEIPVDVCDGFEVTDIIEKMPPVQAIPIPNGATNGDVFKAIFPNLANSNLDLVDVLLNTKSWWNSPYKGVKE